MVPVGAEGLEIHGIRGFMHVDVLKFMQERGPRPEGDYLFNADGGRLRYTLRESDGGSMAEYEQNDRNL